MEACPSPNGPRGPGTTMKLALPGLVRIGAGRIDVEVSNSSGDRLASGVARTANEVRLQQAAVDIAYLYEGALVQIQEQVHAIRMSNRLLSQIGIEIGILDAGAQYTSNRP